MVANRPIEDLWQSLPLHTRARARVSGYALRWRSNMAYYLTAIAYKICPHYLCQLVETDDGIDEICTACGKTL